VLKQKYSSREIFPLRKNDDGKEVWDTNYLEKLTFIFHSFLKN
jgi:hypothetical protein